MWLPWPVSWAVMICLAVSPLPATAGADEPALAEARRLHRDLRYAEALRALDRALDEANPYLQLVEIYELRGLIAAALDRPAEAVRDFSHLLTIDPEHVLPDYVAPRFRALFERARLETRGESIRAFADAPSSVLAGEAFSIELRVESDPLGMVDRVRIAYRVRGSPDIASTEVRAAARARVTLEHAPAPGTSGVLELWCTLLDRRGNELGSVYTPARPGSIAWQAGSAIDPAPAGVSRPGDREEGPAWTRWWFWTAIGAGAAVAGAVTAAVVLSMPATPPCPEPGLCVRLP